MFEKLVRWFFTISTKVIFYIVERPIVMLLLFVLSIMLCVSITMIK